METTTIYSSLGAGSVEVLTPAERGGSSSDAHHLGRQANSFEVRPEGRELVLQLTLSQLSEAIAAALGSVKIYVLESDITEAQRAVRAVVEESYF